ncbi:MAG: glycosyl hydrolase family 28-related protein [Reinekea sp.]
MKTQIERRTFIKSCAAISLIPVFSNPVIGAVWSEESTAPLSATDFNIVAFGAVGDATTDCTAAIQRAIKACHQTGGGRVIIPEGKFLSDTIELLSQVTLHLQDNAELIFNAGSAGSMAMIKALKQQNIAITGTGTLDARAHNDSQWWYGKGYQTNTLHNDGAVASVFEVAQCQDVAFEGVNVRNAPPWLIRPSKSLRVDMNNVAMVS